MTELITITDAADGVRYVTLNRPEKKNAISTAMRAELFATLQAHDHDDAVRVSVIRGAGDCFSSGYDLSSGLMDDPPYHSAPGDGAWSRQATDGWFSIWDLAKPVIAQVHGYAMAGATELASACDLVYVAEDAQISYPVVRVASPPDWQYHEPLLGMRHAMEALLTGDAVDGIEAARIGWANRAYPADRLADEVLAVAVRIAGVAADLTQIKKRLVHRQFDVRGGRAAIRAGQEFQALAGHQASVQAFRADPLGAMARERRRHRPVRVGPNVSPFEPRAADEGLAWGMMPTWPTQSYPRRNAVTRRFTLGAPRDIVVGADGARVAFLRSSGPEDPVNGLWCSTSIPQRSAVLSIRRRSAPTTPTCRRKNRLVANGHGRAGAASLRSTPTVI